MSARDLLEEGPLVDLDPVAEPRTAEQAEGLEVIPLELLVVRALRLGQALDRPRGALRPAGRGGAQRQGGEEREERPHGPMIAAGSLGAAPGYSR